MYRYIQSNICIQIYSHKRIYICILVYIAAAATLR